MIDASHFGKIATPARMPPPDAYRHLDDPDELAELARELPARADGSRRLEAVLTVDGVHCAACVVSIEQALRGAVEEVTVNAATRRARLVFRPDVQPLSGLFARIAALGYAPRPVARAAMADVQAAGRRKALWRMLVAVLCMMQVMMYAVPRYVAGPEDMTADVQRLLMWAEFMLTLPALLFAAGPFLRNAWHDLRARRIGMDVPVSLGIVVTFVASSAAALDGGEVYFDSLTMFVAFLLVGRWLEAAARERALAGVADLLARLPETVERLLGDDRIETVTLRRLRPGDRVRVAVGQAVPADGVVETGRSHADESLLTGESTPIPKRPGDALAAGSLNLSGPLTVRLTRAARDSRLQEIADLVEAASARKPRIAQIADRWAGPFLVAVLVLAALAWAVWHVIDPSRAIWVAASVLVVTCPCALSLATPTALLAAAGTLARRGLLARSPQAIEALASIDAFIFDKTGTLTHDRLSLERLDLLEGAAALSLDEAGVLAVTAALEAGSLHPAATALRRAAASCTLPAVRDLVEHGGAGLSGQVLLDGRWLDARIGSAAFAGVRDEATAAARSRADAVAPGGIRLALEGQPIARVELAETVRADAASALAALRADGASVEILSGDETARVARLAERLELDAWRAEASPQQKLATLAARQAEGRRVAMVGDGINDAPVLARADLSVSFTTAAPLAQHQAELLLLGGRLETLVDARRLARRTMRIVTENLAFAALYNAVSIPLALAGLLPPWLAGLGMAASSLVVVLNALRLADRPSANGSQTASPIPADPSALA
ncbi:MAG: cation-translocating P-type ATPase [Burkholderiales bacterium]|nr:cation-translocating P-type ATPase [Burkholderiales bacterium]